MTTYFYPLISGSTIVLALKIEKALGFLPEAWGNCSSFSTFVSFSDALDAAQKATLDGVMADVNAGLIEANPSGTNYSVQDIMENRATFKTALLGLLGGANFSIYPVGNIGYKLRFTKILTALEKASLRAAWDDLLTEDP